MGNELLATYYYNHKRYNVYGCWDKETPENEFDFYDIFEDDGKSQICINEGELFYELPTRDEVIEFIEQ
jgi:hypothetical protein